MRAKGINEFKQGGNPYDTMGISNTKRIDDWFDSNFRRPGGTSTISTGGMVAPTSYISPTPDYEIENGRISMKKWVDLRYIYSHIAKDNYPSFLKFNINEYINEYNFTDLPFWFIKKNIIIDDLTNDQKLFIEIIELIQIYDKGKGTQSDIDDKLTDLFNDYDIPRIRQEIRRTGLKSSHKSKLIIRLSKINRTQEEIDEDDFINNYFFIGFEAYKKVEIDGEELHKKYMGIENLVKVDQYDAGQLQSVGMMKVRATTVPGGSMYAVKIPNFLADKDNYYDQDIDDQLRKWVEEHKYKV
jgi:hypothetical protein